MASTLESVPKHAASIAMTSNMSLTPMLTFQTSAYAKIDPEKDVIIRGHVTWVGKTSIEVTMNVKQELDGVWHKILEARFLMVARDPQNKV